MRLIKVAFRLFFKLFTRRSYEFTLKPQSQLEHRPGQEFNWCSTGSDPIFGLVSKTGVYPDRWVEIEAELEEAPHHPLLPVLYVNDGRGFRESLAVYLPSPENGRSRMIARLPFRVVALRLDPSTMPGPMRVGAFRIRELTYLGMIYRVILPRLGPLFTRKGYFNSVARKYLELWRSGGVEAMRNRFFGHTPNRTAGNYLGWVKHYDTLGEADRVAMRSRIATLPYKPVISVLMPVYNIEEKWLRRAIESVRRQIYPHWELCIADDHSSKPHVHRVLSDYLEADSRIRVVFRDTNGHISECSNSALEVVNGEYTALMDHDDELAEHALYMVAEALQREPRADLIYSDEDKVDANGVRYHPHFKSDWNPDLFYSVNYLCHLSVYRTELMRKVGGFRRGFEGSQDYDLAIRIVEQTTPDRIVHIPHVLYHWRAIVGSVALASTEKNYAHEAGRSAVQAHFDRCGVPATVSEATVGSLHRVRYSLPERKPLVSIVIGTRDRCELVQRAVDSILRLTSYPNYEIIVVDNQSRDPSTHAYFKAVSADPRVRIVQYDHPFNYSALNNFGVRLAKGELIALVNNDVEVISPDWLSEMASHALRSEIGAVGAKLYYPDSTIQHAGVILGVGEGVAAHSHRALPKEASGYEFRPHLLQSLSAVTAACLLMRRSVYDEVNGLDEINLPVAFNDVDLCLRIRERGYRVLMTPYAELYHLESASRGSDASSSRQNQYLAEMAYMKSRWGTLLLNDPYYNPNLTLEFEDFSLAFPPRAHKPWRARAS